MKNPLKWLADKWFAHKDRRAKKALEKRKKVENAERDLRFQEMLKRLQDKKKKLDELRRNRG